MGVKRKVALYLALLNNSPPILLDEPVMGLDDRSQLDFWKMLAPMKEVHTLVVITHNLNKSQDYADYCGILHKGKLVEFAPMDKFRDESKEYLILRA